MLMKKFTFFAKALLIIIQNFIPHKAIISDDRDLSWLNKELMVVMNLAFKSYCCSNQNMFLLKKVKALLNQLNIQYLSKNQKKSITLIVK